MRTKIKKGLVAMLIATGASGITMPISMAEESTVNFTPFTDNQRGGTPDERVDRNKPLEWEGTDGAPVPVKPGEVLLPPENKAQENEPPKAEDNNSETPDVPSIPTSNKESYVGGDTNAGLPEGVDWNKKIKEVENKLNDAQKKMESIKELTKEEQIAADLLFRQRNIVAQSQSVSNTNSGGVFYPPEAVGGSPIKVDPSVVFPVKKPSQGIALPPNASKVDKLLAAARSAIGTPYVWGGTKPGVGFDCSGLTQWAYSQIGIQIPRVTYDQINQGTPIYNQKDIKPGDLVFPHSGHVGIAISSTEMIHAPQQGETVKVGPIYAFQKGVRLL